MREIQVNTAIMLTKKEIITRGVGWCAEALTAELSSRITKELVNMIAEDLQEEKNGYEFILTVKKME